MGCNYRMPPLALDAAHLLAAAAHLFVCVRLWAARSPIQRAGLAPLQGLAAALSSYLPVP